MFLSVLISDIIFPKIGLPCPASYSGVGTAVCNAGNVVLPLLREEATSYSAPDAQVLPLLKCAKGLGHINVEADNDGVVRSLFLRSPVISAASAAARLSGISLSSKSRIRIASLLTTSSDSGAVQPATRTTHSTCCLKKCHSSERQHLPLK